MPRPANGTYEFTTTSPTLSIVTYELTGAGILTTFGVLVWDPVEEEFRRGGIAIGFIDATHFVAVNGAENLAGTYRKVA